MLSSSALHSPTSKSSALPSTSIASYGGDLDMACSAIEEDADMARRVEENDGNDSESTALHGVVLLGRVLV